MRKFLSVVIPLYNSDNRLKTALNSIQSQSFTDYEVIFVDDCSTNTSYKEIIKEFNFNYKLIVNEKNVAQGLARQIGINAAEGEWITFLDHDDAFSPDCFQSVYDTIKENATDETIVLESNVLVANNYLWVLTQEYNITKNPILLHGRFYNKEKLKQYNIRFREDLRAHEDTFFSTLVEGHSILQEGKDRQEFVLTIDLITYYWYLWDDSVTHKIMENKVSYSEKYFKEYIEANYDAIKELFEIYHNEKFTFYKLTALLLYCYWFLEGFKQNNPNGYLKHNIEYVKHFINRLQEFDITYEQMTDYIMHNPDCYDITYKAALENTGPLIPSITLKAFFDSLK